GARRALNNTRAAVEKRASGAYSAIRSRKVRLMTRDQFMALLTRRAADWRSRNAEALAADHAVDGTVLSPTGGVLEGRADIERIYRLWFTAFPDLSFSISDTVVDGDHAVLLAEIAGTHVGDFFGMTATGRRITVTGAFIYRM